jgi:3-deoxy-D-manno-octulosonic-acid transferase
VSLPLSIYGAAGGLARPVLRRMLRRRLVVGKELPDRVAERYGVASLPRPEGRLIWVHAASVGETMSVLPVIATLAEDCEVLLTTGTVTSATLAAGRLPGRARHQFVPLDVPAWVARFLDHWRPDAAIFVESEVWPTMLRQLDERGIPRLLINARMSAASAARWGWLPGLAGRLLGGFRYIHAQSAGDAANLERLGMRDILLWGNLKYAAPVLPVDEAALEVLRGQLAGPVWLAASTHPGEEAMVVAAHRQLLGRFPGLVSIIVPRHPGRGAEIAALAGAPRRSLGQAPVAGQIYVADTLAELGLFYRAVPFALIGGSLVAHGGQNVVEPARLGVPVLAGPHMENFVEPAAMLAAVGALRRVDGQALADAVADWFSQPGETARLGAAARGVFAGHEDLPGRIADLILDIAL